MAHRRLSHGKVDEYSLQEISSAKVYPEKDETAIEFDHGEHHLKKVEEEKIEEGEAEEKENWGGKLDFFLSCLGYSVGLGAIWRFPYLCYKNGGGAFLIPFIIFIILVGLPLMFLEMSVGQFTSQGPITSWVMVPLFKGIGVSMNLINNYVNIYYIMILAYSLYYLFLSFNTKLPWATCGDWASANCVHDFYPPNFFYTTCDTDLYLKCEENGQCFKKFTVEGVFANCNMNKSLLQYVGHHNPVYPSQDYWQKVILRQNFDMNNTGSLVWQLVLALFIGWIIAFLMLFKGVKVSGKIAYFTALFPYLVLLVLGIRGWMLEGAIDGIIYYIEPKWEKLTEVTVWVSAAVQVFFTLSLSYGGLIALSSYNKFENNILRDAIFLTITNFFTCLLAGFVVFAYMGFLSKKTGIEIDKVVQAGQGLVYVVYPYAVTTIPASPVWAVFFFLMMLALGMGTQMASVETLITSLNDFFPIVRRSTRSKIITLLIVCFLYFLAGLILCTQTGSYWIELFDYYSANWAILLIAFFECVSVSWFYGLNNFKNDLAAMIGKRSTQHILFNWFQFCWIFITPLMLGGLAIFSWIDSKPVMVGDYEFPTWTVILGNLLSGSTLLGVFGWAIYIVINRRFMKKEPMVKLITKDKDWHPRLQKNIALVNHTWKSPWSRFFKN